MTCVSCKHLPFNVFSHSVVCQCSHLCRYEKRSSLSLCTVDCLGLVLCTLDCLGLSYQCLTFVLVLDPHRSILLPFVYSSRRSNPSCRITQTLWPSVMLANAIELWVNYGVKTTVLLLWTFTNCFLNLCCLDFSFCHKCYNNLKSSLILWQLKTGYLFSTNHMLFLIGHLSQRQNHNQH